MAAHYTAQMVGHDEMKGEQALRHERIGGARTGDETDQNGEDEHTYRVAPAHQSFHTNRQRTINNYALTPKYNDKKKTSDTDHEGDEAFHGTLLVGMCAGIRHEEPHLQT